MKICFLTNSIFSLGGVQRVVTVLANELSKEHEVYIICTSDRFDINRDIYNLSESIKVDINPKLININVFNKSVFSAIREINKKTGMLNNDKLYKNLIKIHFPKKVQDNCIKYINDKEYDVIIGVEGYYSLLIATISDSIKAKTYGWQHNSYEAYLKNKGRYYWNRDILFRKYLGNLDKYVVLTEHEREMYKEEMEIECEVIHNPKSFVSTEKSDVSNKQFLAAGRFNYQKGFDLLIESFNEFSKKESEWKLIIVGEGEEEERLKEMIRQYSLEDRIQLRSFTDNIKKYFMESSALLLSSRWEGMPMIVLESLEMGVPVIAYNISATEPLIENNVQGILVEKYDINKFTDEMIKIVKSHELRKEMSKKAINKADEFNVENIVKRWIRLFSM